MYVVEREWNRDEEQKTSKLGEIEVSDSVRSYRYLKYVMNIYLRVDVSGGYVGDSNSFRTWVRNRKFYSDSISELIELFQKAVDSDIKSFKNRRV